jgi:SAM-dependent methyltransferase
MSGFSADWLSLREGADHQARNRLLQDKVCASLAHLKAPRLIDLGCGSGSNLRALAPHLPSGQTWRLVDADKALLAAARRLLSEWADEVQSDGEVLNLSKAGKRIHVEFEEVDLARRLEQVLDHGCDLVTAAAFFDLVAASWLQRFCSAIAARQLAFYTVLTYDGFERWSPRHDRDVDMLAAFHAHQASDKGFGPAAGPKATGVMEEAFRAAGYRVETAPSPWRLEHKRDGALIKALAEGAAQAVAETGRVAPSDLASWLAARSDAEEVEIGHLDFFARF